MGRTLFIMRPNSKNNSKTMKKGVIDLAVDQAQKNNGLFTMIASVGFSVGAAWGLAKTKINGLYRRVDKLENKYEGIDRFLGNVEAKLDNIEKTLDVIKASINKV